MNAFLESLPVLMLRNKIMKDEKGGNCKEEEVEVTESKIFIAITQSVDM